MKIGIIGLGRVGSLAAYTLMDWGYSIKAYDVAAESAKAQMLDLSHAFANDNAKVELANISDMKDCKVIVITAGFPRRAEQSRLDLFGKNRKIVDGILDELDEFENSIVTVTNPVDAINTIVAKKMGRERCFGFGSALDTARLRTITGNANSFVIGEHGEKFVPINVGNGREELKKKIIEDNVLIIKNKMATEFGPAYHIAKLVDGLARKGEFETYVSVVCNGEYGIEGVSIGVPAVIKEGRLEEIKVVKMDEWEKKLFYEGIDSVESVL